MGNFSIDASTENSPYHIKITSPEKDENIRIDLQDENKNEIWINDDLLATGTYTLDDLSFSQELKFKDGKDLKIGASWEKKQSLEENVMAFNIAGDKFDVNGQMHWDVKDPHQQQRLLFDQFFPQNPRLPKVVSNLVILDFDYLLM